ncbi:MAG: RQC domain-containing protein, partial [Steroidobacteraceae bacterium]
FDGTEAAQKLLSCIYRCEKASGFAFGAQHIVDVLRGKRTEKLVERGHDTLTTFGIGADLDESQWRAVLRQLVTLRLVAVDHDHWNVLRLTDASRAVLTGTRRLTLRREPARTAADRRGIKARRSAPVATGSPGEEAVFQALRDWRRGVAHEHAVPAYTVLHDASLREIARLLPDSGPALGGVSGVGATKLARYGAAIIEVVRGAQAQG